MCCSSVPVIDARPEAELVGDRARGDGVVAGDHAHVDAGVERDVAPRRFASARSGSMIPTSATSTRSSTAAMGSARAAAIARVVEVADGERQDAQALLRQLLVGGEELVADVGDRDLRAVPAARGRNDR